MPVASYDESPSNLVDALEKEGINSHTAQYIRDQLLNHLPKDHEIPVEVVSGPGPGLSPVPDVTFTDADDHKGKPDQPELLILETSGNTVNTNLFPDLKFIVQGDPSTANLTITGNK